MTKKLKRGDKITVVSVNSCACTTIVEYTIDSIADDGRLVYAKNRKRFFLPVTPSSLVLIGHSLGIKEGTYKDGTAFNIDAYCNLGGLDRESMISLLQSNLNETFDQWEMIRWFDGVSEVGDPIFATPVESAPEEIEVEEAEVIEPIIEKSAPKAEVATEILPQPQPIENDIEKVLKLVIQDYSDKSFVVIGDTKLVKETLKNLGGRFNKFLKCGAGWVFTKNKLEEVKQALSIA
ncbi:MAG: hypothetical protein SNI70_10115 [Rikenellaceae bacterium]